MSRIMVLGLGNIVNQDKGLGICAVRDLYKEQWTTDVRFVDRRMLDDTPLDLHGVWGLVVLDAWQAGDPPGRLSRLSLKHVMARPFLVSEPALWRSLAVADFLGQGPRVVFWGLEAESTGCEIMLSTKVQRAYPGFLQAVREELLAMIQDFGLAAPMNEAASA